MPYCSPIVAYALRLQPQQDLKVELDRFAVQHQLTAACILTCVGSLTRAVVRLAGETEATVYDDRHEIVSLTGTLSCYGSHCHMAIANAQGQTYGGHLRPGSLIYTTAELVIGVLPRLQFRREWDSTSGFLELAIEELGEESHFSEKIVTNLNSESIMEDIVL